MDTSELLKECHPAENEDPYPRQFRKQIVALAPAGRSIEDLARQRVVIAAYAGPVMLPAPGNT